MRVTIIPKNLRDSVLAARLEATVNAYLDANPAVARDLSEEVSKQVASKVLESIGRWLTCGVDANYGASVEIEGRGGQPCP